MAEERNEKSELGKFTTDLKSDPTRNLAQNDDSPVRSKVPSKRIKALGTKKYVSPFWADKAKIDAKFVQLQCVWRDLEQSRQLGKKIFKERPVDHKPRSKIKRKENFLEPGVSVTTGLTPEFKSGVSKLLRLQRQLDENQNEIDSPLTKEYRNVVYTGSIDSGEQSQKGHDTSTSEPPAWQSNVRAKALRIESSVEKGIGRDAHLLSLPTETLNLPSGEKNSTEVQTGPIQDQRQTVVSDSGTKTLSFSKPHSTVGHRFPSSPPVHSNARNTATDTNKRTHVLSTSFQNAAVRDTDQDNSKRFKESVGFSSTDREGPTDVLDSRDAKESILPSLSSRLKHFEALSHSGKSGSHKIERGTRSIVKEIECEDIAAERKVSAVRVHLDSSFSEEEPPGSPDRRILVKQVSCESTGGRSDVQKSDHKETSNVDVTNMQIAGNKTKSMPELSKEQLSNDALGNVSNKKGIPVSGKSNVKGPSEIQKEVKEEPFSTKRGSRNQGTFSSGIENASRYQIKSSSREESQSTKMDKTKRSPSQQKSDFVKVLTSARQRDRNSGSKLDENDRQQLRTKQQGARSGVHQEEDPYSRNSFLATMKLFENLEDTSRKFPKQTFHEKRKSMESPSQKPSVDSKGKITAKLQNIQSNIHKIVTDIKQSKQATGHASTSEEEPTRYIDDSTTLKTPPQAKQPEIPVSLEKEDKQIKLAKEAKTSVDTPSVVEGSKSQGRSQVDSVEKHVTTRMSEDMHTEQTRTKSEGGLPGAKKTENLTAMNINGGGSTLRQTSRERDSSTLMTPDKKIAKHIISIEKDDQTRASVAEGMVNGNKGHEREENEKTHKPKANENNTSLKTQFAKTETNRLTNDTRNNNIVLPVGKKIQAKSPPMSGQAKTKNVMDSPAVSPDVKYHQGKGTNETSHEVVPLKGGGCSRIVRHKSSKGTGQDAEEVATDLQKALLTSKKVIERQLAGIVNERIESDNLVGALKRSMTESTPKEKVTAATREIHAIIQNGTFQVPGGPRLYRVRLEMGSFSADVNYTHDGHTVTVEGSTKESPVFTKEVKVEFPFQGLDMELLSVHSVGSIVELDVPYLYTPSEPDDRMKEALDQYISDEVNALKREYLYSWREPEPEPQNQVATVTENSLLLSPSTLSKYMTQGDLEQAAELEIRPGEVSKDISVIDLDDVRSRSPGGRRMVPPPPKFSPPALPVNGSESSIVNGDDEIHVFSHGKGTRRHRRNVSQSSNASSDTSIGNTSSINRNNNNSQKNKQPGGANQQQLDAATMEMSSAKSITSSTPVHRYRTRRLRNSALGRVKGATDPSDTSAVKLSGNNEHEHKLTNTGNVFAEVSQNQYLPGLSKLEIQVEKPESEKNEGYENTPREKSFNSDLVYKEPELSPKSVKSDSSSYGLNTSWISSEGSQVKGVTDSSDPEALAVSRSEPRIQVTLASESDQEVFL